MASTRIKATAGIVFAASGLFALTAPSAQAVTVPRVMNGVADSQALKVTLRVPSIPQLRAALVAAGLPVSALPNVDIGEPLVQVIEISTNHGGVTKSDAIMNAGGFARPLAGALGEPLASETCSSGDGCSSNATVAAQRVELPSQLGHVDIAGALSKTLTPLSTVNKTAAVDVNVSLESVLQNATLSAVTGALETLRGQLNTTVVPALNGSIDTVKDTVDGIAALAPLKAELDRIVTVDHIKPIPDLSKVDLVTGRVLGGAAEIKDETVAGTTGLRATSASEIINLQLLGGWASIGSISVSADAFANSVAANHAAKAKAVTDIANVDLGGLLGVHISADDLIHLTESETMKALIRDTAKGLGVNQGLTNIENAIELVYDTAGISIVKLGNSEQTTRTKAEATANSLLVKIEPKLPNFTKLQAGLASGKVPALADSDYVPTGLSLTVELPSATAAVQAASVLGADCIKSCVPVTGVGTPWMVAFALLGLAVTVRKFALSR
jgi:hypothetical protein